MRGFHNDQTQAQEAMRLKDPLNSFWARVNKQGPIPQHVPEIGNCWTWIGVADRKTEYCRFMGMKVHRLSYQLHYYSNIPKGMDCCHKCDNRTCVRPDHLFIGTRSDNVRDCVAKGRWGSGDSKKTHCKHGHPFSGNNLVWYIPPSGGNPQRRCRICINSRQRRHNAKA